MNRVYALFVLLVLGGCSTPHIHHFPDADLVNTPTSTGFEDPQVRRLFADFELFYPGWRIPKSIKTAVSLSGKPDCESCWLSVDIKRNSSGDISLVQLPRRLTPCFLRLREVHHEHRDDATRYFYYQGRLSHIELFADGDDLVKENGAGLSSFDKR